MKKSLIAAAILASSAFASMANAADGTINFTGTISSTTCKVDTKVLTVDMGTVSTTSFGAAGDSSAPSKIDIKVSGCPDGTNASIAFSGPSDASNSNLLALTKGEDEDKEAGGLAIGFFEADGTPIALNSASAGKDLVEDDENTLSFTARYVSTAATVTAGKGNATTEFDIKYN